MMSLRRWLTARYDYTGIGRMFYKRPVTEIIGVAVVAVLTALGFTLFGVLGGDIHQYGRELVSARFDHPHLRLDLAAVLRLPRPQHDPHVVVHAEA
jgi:hypothetical protein